jgi:hypothetical protein
MSMNRSQALQLLTHVRAPLILSAGAVAVVAIARNAIALSTTHRMAWWLPTAALGATIIGGIAGVFSMRSGLSALFKDGRAHRPLMTLTILLFSGYVIAFWFGWTIPEGGLLLSLLMVAVMAAAMSVGALIGFLFGLPRFAYSARLVAPQEGAATGGTKTPATNATSVDYRPSTNLDDIADWLSKIIVGLGLIQLRSAGTYLENITTWILHSYPASVRAQNGFVASLIVAGVIGGFLFGYVWTRLDYAELAASSDVRTAKVLRAEETQSIASVGIGRPLHRRSAGVAVERTRDMGEQQAKSASDDPNQGNFGGIPERDGRRLSAKIAPSELGPGLYRVTLSVDSTNPSQPLKGTVTFWLHPTFRERSVTKPVVDGIASLTIVSYGAFAVGAVVHDTNTRLELDLGQLPDATEDFRSR